MDDANEENPIDSADLEVLAREASAALARQEDRLDGLRRRAFEVIGVASIVFGLFGAFRGDHGITWAIVVALVVFGFLVVVGVAIQFSGRKPWYFVQDVTAIKKKRSSTIADGKAWNLYDHLATDLEKSYEHNQPRLDYRGGWLAAAFVSLGVIVVFLTIDLIITNSDRSTDVPPAIPAATTTTGHSPP